MIKFFRKIRQRLLTENKFIKYLIYAIGEIVLVVIGILIALQLNNLNDQRKSKETVQVYYEQLLQDFEVDRAFIEETTAYYDSNNVKVEEYKATFVKAELPTIAILGEVGKLDWLMRDIRFESTAISTLQNTGDIKLLTTEIREKLLQLKTLQERAVHSSSKNLDVAMEMATYASRFYGSEGFVARLSSQPKLLEYTMNEERMIQMLTALEAAARSKEYAENKNLEKFKEIITDMDELIRLVKDELENE